jgi:hypothetical protein
MALQTLSKHRFFLTNLFRHDQIRVDVFAIQLGSIRSFN